MPPEHARRGANPVGARCAAANADGATLAQIHAKFSVARYLLRRAPGMKQVVVCALLSGLLACGGRVEDPKSGGAGGGDSAPVSSSAGGAKSPPDTLPSHALGDCKPGFERASNPTRACNWLTDGGLCFDTNDDACSCICPPDKDSVCYSPFYNGTGSATPVNCE